MKSAIIAGATGLIGESLTHLLVNDPDFSAVIVLVRKSGVVSTKIQSPKLKEVVVDFSRLKETLGNHTAQHWFCTLGTTIKKAGSREAFILVDKNYVIEFAKIASERHCESFHLVTAMEANPHSKMFYSRVKGETEEVVKSLAIKSLSIYRPSLLDGDRQEKRPAEHLAMVASRLLGKLIPKSVRMIHVSKIARTMIFRAKFAQPGVRILLSAEMQDS